MMRELVMVMLMFALPISLLNAARSGDQLENGSFDAQLDGFRIHYEVHGSGPVCMVMPVSWGMSHEGMRGFLKGLEPYLTMVYFDPRGLGRSEEVREESDRSLAAVRADFDALRQHLGLEKVILLGWSNSGFNSIKYAGTHPDAVSRLLLLHTFHEIKPEWLEGFKTFAARMRELMTPDRSEDDLNGLMRRMLTEEWPPAMLHDVEKIRGQYLEIINSADVSWRNYLYMNETDLPNLNAVDEAGRIKVPVLIICGRHDELPPELVEEMHKAIAGSKMVVLENSAHFGPIEEPEAFIQAVRGFLGL
jgi:proline iminopeptidase